MSSLIPYICCRDAAKALEFYKEAFGATEIMRLPEPSGKIGHAELLLNGAMLFLSDEYPDYGCQAPDPSRGSAVTLHLGSPDVDAFVAQAAAKGATIVRPPTDQFYGHRTSTLMDPFGHRWMVSTVKEELSNEEITRRYEELCNSQGERSNA